jgi:flagellar basal-body rod modification protein FlgD
MTLSSVTNSTSSSASSATGTSGIGDTQAAAQKTTLDKDAFLKLLVAQMSHQDPLQPQDSTAFVAQLSQFAMVEQSIAQSSKLDTISTQMTGMASNEAASLVGKTVTVRNGTGISYDGVSASTASVNLAGPADQVSVQVQDSTGATVRTLQLGAEPAGAVQIKWDGRDDNGQACPKGSYTVKVSAQTKDGKSVAASQDVSGTVTKVTFDQGYPQVQLDSGVTAAISDLVGVGGSVR